MEMAILIEQCPQGGVPLYTRNQSTKALVFFLRSAISVAVIANDQRYSKKCAPMICSFAAYRKIFRSQVFADDLTA